jgi:hypothetical protein
MTMPLRLHVSKFWHFLSSFQLSFYTERYLSVCLQDNVSPAPGPSTCLSQSDQICTIEVLSR